MRHGVWVSFGKTDVAVHRMRGTATSWVGTILTGVPHLSLDACAHVLNEWQNWGNPGAIGGEGYVGHGAYTHG